MCTSVPGGPGLPPLPVHQPGTLALSGLLLSITGGAGVMEELVTGHSSPLLFIWSLALLLAYVRFDLLIFLLPEQIFNLACSVGLLFV